MVVGVSCFTTLEKYVRVLRRAADNRSFRAKSMFDVEGVVNTFEHGSQIIIGKEFDLFDFMRSAETIKEVHERNARTQG